MYGIQEFKFSKFKLFQMQCMTGIAIQVVYDFENGFVIDLSKWDVKLSLNYHRHLE